jgi:hypothetical protein
MEDRKAAQESAVPENTRKPRRVKSRAVQTDAAALDVPAAADFLGVAARSVQDPRWRARVNLPAYRVGRRLLFRPEALRAFIARHTERLAGDGDAG